MNKCGDCMYFNFCEKHTTKDETFPETNGCTAFEKKPNKELHRAIKMLKAEYEKAKLLKFVYNPLAYALYQVWKVADRKVKKNESKN